MAHSLFREVPQPLRQSSPVVGRAGQQERPARAARGVVDGVFGFLEVHGGRHAGAVGVQSGPAVRHHPFRDPALQSEPVHPVAQVRLHDLRRARPAADLEEHPHPGVPTGRRAMVDDDGHEDVLRVDDDAGLLQGLPDQRRDHIFAGIQMSGRQW